jgi:hypothetical protein
VAQLEAAVTTIDANMSGRVWENAVQRTAVCLEIEGGRFERVL